MGRVVPRKESGERHVKKKSVNRCYLRGFSDSEGAEMETVPYEGNSMEKLGKKKEVFYEVKGEA